MPPTHTLSFLGVELDTVSCGISLPQEKSHESAAVLLTVGGYFRVDWFYFNFSLYHPACSCLHINHKETLAIILAATRWGHLWANHRVIIYSDKTRVQIINKGTTNNKIIMQELRALFWLWVLLSFYITATYLEGFCNTIADAVWRLHKRPHLLSFYSVPKGCAAAANLALTDHTSSHDRSFEFFRCTRPSVGISIITGNY